MSPLNGMRARLGRPFATLLSPGRAGRTALAQSPLENFPEGSVTGECNFPPEAAVRRAFE